MDVSHFVTMTTAAGAALCTAVGYLFKLVLQMHKEQLEMAKTQAETAEKVGELRGENKGVTQLSASVLQTVKDAIEGNDE